MTAEVPPYEETPEMRQGEVIVSHRLGYLYPDPETATAEEIAEADAYLEAHIQWRIEQANQKTGEVS